MSFVKKIIGPDETLIGITSAHWIYGLTGIAWLAGMMIVGLVLDFYATGIFDNLFRNTGGYAVDKIADALFWIATALGVVMFFLYFLMMISPEIGLTTKRVIYKRGLIFVDVKEVDLEEIKAADVNNGFFGRFLNYGFVIFDARFVGSVDLPAIGHPYRFVKALNDARSALKSDSMTVVVDGVGDTLKKEVGEAVKKEIKEQEPEKKPKKTQKRQEKVKKSGKTPKLSDDRYEENVESGVQAMGAVINETKENMQHAITGEIEDPRPEKKKRGLMLFNSKLLQRERWLRSKIKDNFTETSQ